MFQGAHVQQLSNLLGMEKAFCPYTPTINKTIKLKLLGIWLRSARKGYINYFAASSAKCELQINYLEQASANLAETKC